MESEYALEIYWLAVGENQYRLRMAFADYINFSFGDFSIKSNVQLLVGQVGNTALYSLSTISFYLLTESEYALEIY